MGTNNAEGSPDKNEQNESGNSSSVSHARLEAGLKETTDASGNSIESWDDDPENPYNWPTRTKALQVLMLASAAFTT